MKITNLPIIDITDCYTLKDIAIKLNLPLNGRSNKQVKEYLIHNNIDSSHLDPNKNRFRKYEVVSKTCPICSIVFETREGADDEKTTCSIGCSNTYFRSGQNSPNFKNGKSIYRKYIDIKKCTRCDYDEIVEILQVHHKDRNRENNTLDNLEVLCPNCHAIEHFLKKDGIFTQNKLNKNV